MAGGKQSARATLEGTVLPAKKYLIELDHRRHEVEKTANSNWRSKRLRKRAEILLLCDIGPNGPGWSDDRVAAALGCSRRTVERVRQSFWFHDFEYLHSTRPPETEWVPKLSGKVAEQLLALWNSDPPKGQAQWTLRLLAETLVK